jgi:hypothetical protein
MLYQKKEVTCEEKMKLDEEAVEECLNADSDASVVFQLTDCEIVHMVMHPNKGVDMDDDIDEGTNDEEYISIDRCVSFNRRND